MDQSKSVRRWSELGLGLIIGLVFIAVGVTLLLTVQDYLTDSIWYVLWRFWPVVFVIVGLQLIAGKSKLATIGTFLISLLLVIATFSFAFVASDDRFQPWLEKNISGWTQFRDKVIDNAPIQQSTQVISKSKHPTAENINLNIEIPDNQFSFRDEVRAIDLLTLTTTFFADMGTPELNSTQTGNLLEIVLKAKSDKDSWLEKMLLGQESPGDSLVWDSNSPINELNLNLGSGNADFLLNQVRIDHLNIEQGSGNLSLDLRNMKSTQNIKIDLKSGNVDLKIPANAHLQIEYSVKSGNVMVLGESLKKEGEYTSELKSGPLVKLTIEVASGNVDIATD